MPSSRSTRHAVGVGSGAVAIALVAAGVAIAAGPGHAGAVAVRHDIRQDPVRPQPHHVASPAHHVAARHHPQAVHVAEARPAPAVHRAIDPSLQARVADRMSRSSARRYGIVVDVAGVGRVVSLGPTTALRPASTQKLFTTLPVLLDQPNRRLVTTITAANSPVNGTVAGDLVVHATADPSMLIRDFSDLARQLRDAGVRHVTGHLVLDIGTLPTNTRRAGWKSDYIPDEVGPLSAFPVYEDVWRHDSTYIADPTSANLRLLRQHIRQAGVSIARNDTVVRGGATGHVLARHRSRPLRVLVKQTLRISDNFYAEQLLTIAGGHARVASLEQSAGITGTSKATDGSGLSYSDHETAQGEVTLLHYAARHAAAYALLHASLPVGCKYGTLKHRFCHTPAAGLVFAKTGTLDHTTALSGYTVDAAGHAVTFSIITTGVHSLAAAEKATDKAVLLLRRYTG
ncbi:MAG: D-alanyl-D-alanine carboxypeptidase [Frankiales bacterium]|nr:D-alanyl-D-alanine carboxypeptidase [Frankiales bacterium]